MNIRKKCLTVALISLMLPATTISVSSPASSAWLVRGYPLHVGYHRYYHRRYAYRGFRNVLYGRNLRSGFFLHCAGTYGVPIC